MNTEGRLKLQMAVHVRDFFRAYSFGSPKADAIVAKFVGRVDRGLFLIAQEQDGLTAEHAASVEKADVRREINKGALHHLSRVAQSAPEVKPELADRFRKAFAHQSAESYRAAIGTIALDVKANQELFVESGMLDGAFEDFTQQLGEYDRVCSDAAAARRAHTGARKELRGLTSELIRMVRQLEGMVRYRWRDSLDVLGAWDSARNVAWRKNPPVEPVGESEPPTSIGAGTA